MSTGAVPDVLKNAQLARIVSELKSRQAVTSREAVTGKYEDVTKATGGDIGGVDLISKAIADAQTYQTSLALAANRAAITQNALSVISEDGSRISTNVLSALGTGDQSGLRISAEDAKQTLGSIFSALNTADGGRSLFGGDVTDQPPLGDVNQLLSDVRGIIAAGPDVATINAALDTYFNDPAGGFQTTIYQGGTNDAPGVETAPGVRVNASTRADAQPFRDLMRGLAVIANYDALPPSAAGDEKSLLQSSATLAHAAGDGLTNLRGLIGVAEQRISTAKDQHAAEETAFTNILNDKTSRDPFEAAASLQNLDSQLQASYLVTARLAKMSLADYLG
ncbi:MAG: hypothetical protein GC153_08065 [Alphaproteobacteria bacterium]|nr:hypothetical protein [Alphaproteobacteria bacterium]